MAKFRQLRKFDMKLTSRYINIIQRNLSQTGNRNTVDFPAV